MAKTLTISLISDDEKTPEPDPAASYQNSASTSSTDTHQLPQRSPSKPPTPPVTPPASQSDPVVPANRHEPPVHVPVNATPTPIKKVGVPLPVAAAETASIHHFSSIQSSSEDKKDAKRPLKRRGSILEGLDRLLSSATKSSKEESESRSDRHSIHASISPSISTSSSKSPSVPTKLKACPSTRNVRPWTREESAIVARYILKAGESQVNWHEIAQRINDETSEVAEDLVDDGDRSDLLGKGTRTAVMAQRHWVQTLRGKLEKEAGLEVSFKSPIRAKNRIVSARKRDRATSSETEEEGDADDNAIRAARKPPAKRERKA